MIFFFGIARENDGSGLAPARVLDDRRFGTSLRIDSPPKDSIYTITEQSTDISRAKPRNPLLNECAYCSKNNREWYHSVEEFKHMCYVCGFDFVQVRISRAYTDGRGNGSADFYLSVFPKRIQCDSIIYRYIDEKENRAVNVPAFQISSEFSSLFLETDDNLSVDDIDTIAAFIKTFKSQMVCSVSPGGQERTLIFSIGDKHFCLSQDGAVGPCSNIRIGQSGSSGAAAYRLGSFDDAAYARSKRALDHELPPVIRKCELFDYNGTLSAGLEVESFNGIHEITFQTTTRKKTILLPDEKQISALYPLDCGPNDSSLTISIVDRFGIQTSRNMPIFVQKRVLAARMKKRREMDEIQQVWADKSIVNKTLFFLSKFDVGVGGVSVSGIGRDYCLKKSLEYVRNQYGRRVNLIEYAGFKDPRTAAQNEFFISYPVRSTKIFPGHVERNGPEECITVFYRLDARNLPDQCRTGITTTLDGAPRSWKIQIDSLEPAAKAGGLEAVYTLFLAGDTVFSNDTAVILSCSPKKVLSFADPFRFTTLYATNDEHRNDTLICYAALRRRDGTSVKGFSHPLLPGYTYPTTRQIRSESCRGQVCDRIVYNGGRSEVCMVSSFELALQKDAQPIERMDLFLFNCRQNQWVAATSALVR